LSAIRGISMKLKITPLNIVPLSTPVKKSFKHLTVKARLSDPDTTLGILSKAFRKQGIKINVTVLNHFKDFLATNTLYRRKIFIEKHIFLVYSTGGNIVAECLGERGHAFPHHLKDI